MSFSLQEYFKAQVIKTQETIHSKYFHLNNSMKSLGILLYIMSIILQKQRETLGIQILKANHQN